MVDRQTVESLTDESLMLRVRDDDVETLSVLYERHRSRLLNFFVRLTGDVSLSEDLVHDVFVRMLRYRHTFAPGNRFTTWMYRVARNVHFDSRHKRRNEVPLEDDQSDRNETLASTAPAPDLEANAREETALLQKALQALPLEFKEVLVLSRFGELRYEEIARVLECSLGAVKMRMHRALRELKQNYHQLAGRRYEL